MKKKELFPQANNLELMFEIYKSFPEEGLLKEDVALTYNIDVRQGAYYLDSLVFVDLVKKINMLYIPTMRSISFKKNKTKKEELNWFCKRVLEHRFFEGILKTNTDGTLKLICGVNVVEKIMTEYGLSISTATRRAACIRSWLDWIQENTTGVLCDE